MTHQCTYKGQKERCLTKNSYPITKNGQLNCGRVRNAVARASTNNDLSKIKKGGILTYIRKCKIDSKLLKK